MWVPASSYWVYQACKLSAPFPGHFSGLCLQGAAQGMRRRLLEDKKQACSEGGDSLNSVLPAVTQTIVTVLSPAFL